MPIFASDRFWLRGMGTIWFACLMSAATLSGSPQRPFVHEQYGPAFLISWPAGQKLHEEAMSRYYGGDYVGLFRTLDEAVAQAQRLSLEREKDVAIFLTTKAQALIQLGDSKDAAEAIAHAEQMADAAVEADHPIKWRVNFVRSGVQFLRGDLPGAMTSLERCFAVQTSASNTMSAAMSLRAQALFHLVQGNVFAAEESIQRSSRIIEAQLGKESFPYGENLSVEAVIIAAKGDYGLAIRHCESSLKILTNCVAPQHIVLVAVRKGLADNYQQLGDYKTATGLLVETLRTLEKTVGQDNILLSGVLDSLGLLHYRLGNYLDAERFWLRCLKVRENTVGADSWAYANTVNNLAVVLMANGRDSETLELLNAAAATLDTASGKYSPHLATVLLNAASVTRRRGYLDTAEILIKKVIIARDRAFGKDHPAIAEAAEEYARIQCDRGNFSHALHLVSLALSIKTNLVAHDTISMADTISTAASIFSVMQDYPTAAEFYAESAFIRAKVLGVENPAFMADLEASALALCKTNKHLEAVQPLLTALRAQRVYLISQAARTDSLSALSLAGSLFYRTELLHSLCAQNSDDVAITKSAEQLALNKALLEEMQVTQASLEADPRTSTHELRDKLDAIQNQLNRLPESKLDPSQRDARRQQLQAAKSLIEEELAEWNGLVAQTIRERNLTLTGIGRSLPPQSVLVDFIQYERYDFTAKTNQWKEDRYAAYLTFPLAANSTNVVVTRVDLGEAALINDAVELINKRMSAGQYAARDVMPALQRLSELVYAPVARHLTNVSHLILCPEGQLNRLPFEMLPVGAKFLVEEKTISYVTSGREIVRIASAKRHVQSSASLVMGNPDFDFDLPRANRHSVEPQE